MSLPSLESALRDAYLARLGVAAHSRDLAGLTALQRAHIERVPFHNLALIANAGRRYQPPSLAAIATANAAGVGGTCHLTTPAFATLLRTLGFEVELVAGTVNHPGDHLLARVALATGHYIVDVGNGHPYLHPFPLGQVLAWGAHGWRFRWERDTLYRTLEEGRSKLVYRVDPRPRTWPSFEDAIRAHHEQPGFGPFLDALRAVRVHSELMLVVRGASFSRYSALGCSRRRLGTRGQASRVLRHNLGLPPALVDEALSELEGRRPELFGTDAVDPRPRVLIAIPTIGRWAQLAALLDSVEVDRRASGLGVEEVEVVVVDNQAPGGPRPALEDRPFAVHHYALTEPVVEQRLGLVPSQAAPLCIGGVRHALVRVLTEHLRGREEPWLIWILDDDLRLTQFLRDPRGGVHERHSIALMAALRRLWLERPDLSIGLGWFCGAPPIPGFATWLGQVHDLEATLAAMAGGAPDDPWIRAQERPQGPDDYYDHADDRLSPGPARCFDPPPGASTFGHTFVALAEAWPEVIHGTQVMRPLVWSPGAVEPPFARGGNVVCLDIDALLAAPFPALRCQDGVVTRRADSLALALTDRRLWHCERVELPVVHGRRMGDASSPTARAVPDTAALARFAESQARGLALTRAFEQSIPVAKSLARRRALHRQGFAETRKALADARARLVEPASWWWTAPWDSHARLVLAGLDTLAAHLPSDTDLDDAASEVDQELEAFVAALPELAAGWRRSWV